MKINLPDRSVKFPITIADVSQPILGADFLAEAYLAPNHRDGTLVDLRDFSTIKVDVDCENQPIRISHVSQADDPCYKLLDGSFPNLSNPSFRIKEVDHGVEHFIPTDGPPVQSKARKLSPDKLEVARQELEKLVALGVCERGKSDWSSPLLVTTKPCSSPCTCQTQAPCGGWRVCGDYRRLNNQTTTDRYPVRNLQDFNNHLRGKKYFSKVDLLKGYHQIPVHGPHVKKTAVITPFGLFIFPRCPFGLKNAGQDFQRMMDAILGDIPYAFVYLDDILIASATLEEHLQHLKEVFTILEKNGLVVNRKKCILGQSSLEFLGHLVDQNGIMPLPEKVEAIVATTPPTSIKQLQRFHGMVNYYRRFIKAAAHHLHALFNALQGKPKRLDWTPQLQESFDGIKEALINSTMLHHPDPSLPLALTTDASDLAIGGVVEQRGPDGWEPLGFFSKKLTVSQQNWCPYDRELHGVHKSIRHFKHLLEGRSFTIYTDHQSLIPSLAKKTDAPTARQTNMLSEIAEYSTDIQYLEGKSNFVADCLSRPNEPETSAKKKPPSVSNVSQWKPEVHPFKQAILDMQKNKLEPFESIHDDEDWQLFSDMEERFEKLLKTNTVEDLQRNAAAKAKTSSKQQTRHKKVSFSSPESTTWSDIVKTNNKTDGIEKKEHLPSVSTIQIKTASAAAAGRQSLQHTSSNSDPQHVVRPKPALKHDVDDPMMTIVTKKNSKSHREAEVAQKQAQQLVNSTNQAKNQQATATTTATAHEPIRSTFSAPADVQQPAKTSTESKTIPNSLVNIKTASQFRQFLKDVRDIPFDGPIQWSEPDQVDDEEEKQAESIAKNLEENKVQDLQMVVNAIEHYDLDLEELARQQVLDPDFQRLTNDARTGLSFRKLKIGNSDLYVDVSNGPARPFVPLAMRKRVFDIIHGLGHPGVARTRQAIAAKFVWPSINADVSAWARRCLDCQRAKVNRHTVTPIGDFEVPHKRFSHINADLVSMPLSNGFNHLLTIVDRHSRWPVAIPIKDIAAETVVDAFAQGWVAHYGVPEKITTDRGSQFSSVIWRQLSQVWGIKHIMTTAYHPEANGMVERLHRRLKESLMALVNAERNRWFWKLPMTLLALRTTVKADLNASPSDLVYGESVAVPGQILPSAPLTDEQLLQQQRRTLSNLRVEVDRLQPVQTSAHRRPAVHVPDELDTCTHVFIRRGGVQPSMTTPYEGPFRVLERTEDGFRIEFPGRGSDIIAKARLRPAITARNDPNDQQHRGDDDEDDDDEDDIVPPSPPPAGRRPGWRTRRPQPTTRVTRSQRQLSPPPPTPSSTQSSSNDNDPLTQAAADASSQESVDTAVQAHDDPDPNHGHVPPDENLAPCPCDPPSGPCGPETTFNPPRQLVTDALNNRGGVVPRRETPSFSRPKPGNFSYRRRRPDVSALKTLIQSHLRS